ncbi:MAG: hypothetical protein MZW92_03800 [Comamonadaceae bacterium]|nr:hypothetical protein [Comamonadaceae bacterium]
MDIFGSRGEGDATADKSEVDAVYKINREGIEAGLRKISGVLRHKKGWSAGRVIFCRL